MLISLNSIDKVKNFVDDAALVDATIDLISDRCIINAKSIMGIFSLDLTKPIEIILTEIRGDKQEVIHNFNELVSKYKV